MLVCLSIVLNIFTYKCFRFGTFSKDRNGKDLSLFLASCLKTKMNLVPGNYFSLQSRVREKNINNGRMFQTSHF